MSEGLGSAYNEGFQSLVDTSSRDYVYDEVDQYHDNINQAGLDEAARSMKVHKSKKVSGCVGRNRKLFMVC